MTKHNLLNIFTTIIFSLLLLIVVMPANAYKYQSALSINQAVSNFLYSEIQTKHYTISKIDKRLRLKQCSSELNTAFPQYAEHIGRTTVEVSCNDAKPWKILVSAYIRKYLDILVSRHALPAGSVITKNDIRSKRTEISRVRGGYFSRVPQLKNMVVRRAIRTGKIISPTMLKPKQLVRRGDEVLILAQTNNLRIKVKGKALMDGFLGQRIKVKNMNSQRIFQATVISNGLVKVNM